MKFNKRFLQLVSSLIIVLFICPCEALAQSPGWGGTPSREVFSRQQLEQLVAPIALYPDEVVAQVLMASTYPLEVVQAGRWVKKNKNLNGDALAAALEKDVMDTVQTLRRKAEAAGNLKTTPEQTVVVEKETIIVQPSNPQIIYIRVKIVDFIGR